MLAIGSVVDAAAGGGSTLAGAADRLVATSRSQGRRVPGFGHRQHRDRDPRLDRLVAVAREVGVAGDHLAAAEAVEAALTRSVGRAVPINIDGAMAALLGEVGFPSDLGNALFIALPPRRDPGPRQRGTADDGPDAPQDGPGRTTRTAAPAAGGSPRHGEGLGRRPRRPPPSSSSGTSSAGASATCSGCAGTPTSPCWPPWRAATSSSSTCATSRSRRTPPTATPRVTGRAGVVLSHLSPGLTNAATGVANAALDCIPMVVIAGDVPSHYFGRHPHQEVNLHADASQYEIYRPFVKRAWRVDRAELLPEIVEKAFLLAESGQPGPVLVDVPMDVFSQPLDPALFARLAHNTRQLVGPSLDN